MTNGSPLVMHGQALLSPGSRASSGEIQTNVCYSRDEDEGLSAS